MISHFSSKAAETSTFVKIRAVNAHRVIVERRSTISVEKKNIDDRVSSIFLLLKIIHGYVKDV